MINIPLQILPNQSFSSQLAGNNYDIRIHDCNGLMAVDVIINQVAVVLGIRAVAGFPIIPSAYLENGNFVIVTADYEYPDWRRFTIDQFLVFASQAEIDAINAEPFDANSIT